MAKQLNLPRMFASDADHLRRARDKALDLHPTNIKAAGNEIEEEVRAYLRRMLPSRYYITNGHLIDSNHRISPQLDIIISDNFNLPSLVTTKDGTEYVPITSVLAIGEVKSTYYRSKSYYQGFHETISVVNNDLLRPLIKNSTYSGLTKDLTMRDMIFSSPNKYLNNLYYFLLCIDDGDFDFDKIRQLLNSTDPELLPNLAVFLDKGIIGYAKTDQNEAFQFCKYPNQVNKSEYDWFFAEGYNSDEGSPEGSHLALLYGQLINHLSTSRLEPPNVYPYTSTMTAFRKSTLEWAKHDT